MKVLADTNILIDALKKKRRRDEFLESFPVKGFTLCICAVVMSELYSGVMGRDLDKAQGMTKDFLFLSTTSELGRLAGVLRKRQRDAGIALSTPDCLIAATAIHYDAMLITDNQKDFPVPELRFYPVPAAS